MLSKNLKKYRKEANLTQDELAELIGYERTVIVKFENGTLEPKASTVKALADVLNIGVEKLYED